MADDYDRKDGSPVFKDESVVDDRSPQYDTEEVGDGAASIGAQKYSYTEDRKIGVTGAVFLILNKMIGTGSKSPHPLPSYLAGVDMDMSMVKTESLTRIARAA